MKSNIMTSHRVRTVMILALRICQPKSNRIRLKSRHDGVQLSKLSTSHIFVDLKFTHRSRWFLKDSLIYINVTFE